MTKQFNNTGVCIPEKHYMADISMKITRIFAMVEKGNYFTINRPNQYGKTTVIYMLNKFLKTSPEYFPIKMSFEGMGSESCQSEAAFIEALMPRLKTIFEMSGNNDLVKFIESADPVDSMNKLDLWFTKLVRKIGKKVVLMIDEVDKNSNNQLFLDFLGILRAKYLKYHQGEDFTFHSVILAGVHDVKTLKIKLRPESEARYNSPWNIAVDFEVDLSLSPQELTTMLEDYVKEQKVKMDIPFFAENLFYFTSGYPFLVSYLCKIIAEELLPLKSKRAWEPHDLVQAVQIALMKNNTNFDTLIKNLENNPDLYEMVFKIIMNEKEFSYNLRNPVIHIGTIYGILRKEQGKTRIHNRLYEQVLYDYMSSKLETSGGFELSPISSSYIRKDGTLDIEKVIRKFQEFMIEQYSRKDAGFIERNGRLLFLAFIKPIINGEGFDFKEVQVSEERRLDIVVTFGSRKYIIELKIWRGEAYHQEGIQQLYDYLDRQHQRTGYLLIFDPRKEKGQRGQWEKIEKKGKEINAFWI